MKKLKYFLGIKHMIRVLTFLFVLGISTSCRVAPSLAPSQQIDKWISANTDSNQFELSDIQELPLWSAAYVFPPYTSTTTINQTLGFEWQDVKRFKLDARDDIHLAVFVSGSNVVYAEEWKRDKFDCSPMLSGQVLTPRTVIQIDRLQHVPLLTISESESIEDGAN